MTKQEGSKAKHETWHDGKSPLSRKAGTPLLQQASISAVAEGYRPLKNKDNDQRASTGSQVSRHVVVFPSAPSQLLRVYEPAPDQIASIRDEESIKRRGIREPFRSGYLVAGTEYFPGPSNYALNQAPTRYTGQKAVASPTTKHFPSRLGWDVPGRGEDLAGQKRHR
ncbi:hypothetical protein DTO271G3_8319 [Paecilomyces variotii]|nr:hypothetical protein DTO271G3_8319 [Paecilomyces variotii]